MLFRRPRLGPIAVVLTAVILLAVGASRARHAANRHAAAVRPTSIDDPHCRPPREHPSPVLLVHGTFADTDWGVLAPALARRGYCVYEFRYGNAGTGEIAQSAHELSRFVSRVLSRTGAARVSIVGHSEGGMMPRYCIRFLGGADKVDVLIGLSPSNHGSVNPLLLEGAALGCAACAEQEAFGSAFLDRLNRGDEAPGPVRYVNIQTVDDTVVLPYTSAFLSGPGTRVTNVTVQASCPDDVVSHVAMPTDPVVIQWVEHALAHAGRIGDGFHPRC